MKVIPCYECGKMFSPPTRNAKYCSDECRTKALRRQKREWYYRNREDRMDIKRRRKKRMAREKARRIRESVRLAVEMGLREPDDD